MPTQAMPGAWQSMPLNLDCPENTPPLEGDGAARGTCCYRNEPNSSVVARELAANPGANVTTYYRMNYQVQNNHPNSLNLMALINLAIGRADNEEQSLLIGFDAPRKADGTVASGRGNLIVGQGRYNCDGTYSYYSETAAPTGKEFPGGDDPGRWRKQVVPVTYDETLSGRDQANVTFAENYNGNSYTVFVGTGTFVYDWEIVTQAFDISKIDTSVAGVDCQGSRDGMAWTPGMEFIVYTTLGDNHFPATNSISALQGITFSQLVAFGLTADPASDPTAVPRCEPGSAGCAWIKLPQYLCPENEQEAQLFRCHAGAPNDENEPVNCSMTAPTTARDESAPDDGQCCDPLGMGTNGLPACNSYILKSDVVAASARVTATDGQLVQDCTP